MYRQAKYVLVLLSEKDYVEKLWIHFWFIHKSNSNINNKYVNIQGKHSSYMHQIKEVISNQWIFLGFCV